MKRVYLIATLALAALIAVLANTTGLPMRRSLPSSPGLSGSTAHSGASRQDGQSLGVDAAHRSPVDFVFANDQRQLVTANQVSDTISLIDIQSGQMIAEAPCGQRPSNVAISPDGKYVLATAWFSGEVSVYALTATSIKRVASIQLGFEPRGVAISPDGVLAYVALTTDHSIAVLDLSQLDDGLLTVTDRIVVGRWPRYLALSADGSRMAVGCNGDGGVGVVDTVARKQLFTEEFAGLNLGQMQISSDGKFVYFPWIVYRQNPITSINIRRGWVIASRIARVRMDKQSRREAISLDPEGQAVGDPYGMALSPDEQTLVCTASGTHELLVYRLSDLPFQDYGGPGDHIAPELLKDRQRFDRIPLGGRPMTVRYSKQGDLVYIANYLRDAIQVVDVSQKKLVRTIELSHTTSSDEPAQPSLVRQGEEIFYDAKRSLDQWYSCHSCHFEGHTSAVTMDTFNDGRAGNFKAVLTLRGATETGPWFWHGWAKEFHVAVRKSLTDTMLGPEPNEHDVQAVAAFIGSLKWPDNPFQSTDALRALPGDPVRGETIFRSDKAACATCHPAPLFADGQTHDVGLGESDDVFDGYNTPSLRGTFDRPRWLHDGRARTLEEVLRGAHSPERVSGTEELTEGEVRDLVAYLRTL